LRHLLVYIHRYAGLVLAGFLILSGGTGALLAFKHELDSILNADMLHAPAPVSDAQPLDPIVLGQIIISQYPGASIKRLELEFTPGESMSFRLDWPKNSGSRNDEVFIHPYTGEILGERKWGDISQGLHNLMPFLFRLHHSLTFDSQGTTVLGIVALLWTLDCFVGAYLTFPAQRHSARQRNGSRNWLRRWGHAWKIRWGSSFTKVNFDLHRASGLWPWLLLLVIAWSSVGFNLREQVYWPVMRIAFDQQDPLGGIAKLGKPRAEPGIPLAQARDIGRQLMAEQARQKNFAVLQELNLSYDASRDVYRYRVKSDRDIRDEGGSTSIWFDGDSGRLKAIFIPTGAADGDTVTTWLYAFHMAAIGGTPFKIAIFLLGSIVMLLSITGVFIWWQKNNARRVRRTKLGHKPSHPSPPD
jgi:uncharacterized iron-regulated membrane protein